MAKIQVTTLTIAALILGLSLGGGAGYLLISMNYQPRISDLETRLTQMNQTITNQQDQIYSLQEIRSNLETRLTQMNQTITYQQNQFYSIQEIRWLRTELDRLTSSPSYTTALNQRIAQLEAELRTLTSAKITDSYESFPGNWTINTRGGDITRSQAEKHGGNYSARFSSPEATTNAYAYTDMPYVANIDFHVQLWFYVDYSLPPDHLSIAGCRDLAEYNSFAFMVTDYGGSCYLLNWLPGNGYNPSNYETVTKVSENSWHKLDLYWSNATRRCKVVLDDVDYGWFLPNNPNVNAERFYIGDTTVGGLYGLIYVDDLLIERQP